MNLTEQLLAGLSLYGLPLLFGVTFISAIGVPLPITLLLVAAGSFVEQGDMNFWHVVGAISAAAIAGDQVGYLIGRWGGRKLVFRMGKWFNKGEASLKKAEATARKWEGMGVFLSRWLVTPLGPWLNLTSGFTGYPWQRFILWDSLGEILWVLIYVLLGRMFSDRVQAMTEVLGNLTWVLLGLAGIAFFGWKLWSSYKSDDHSEDKLPADQKAAIVNEVEANQA